MDTNQRVGRERVLSSVQCSPVLILWVHFGLTWMIGTVHYAEFVKFFTKDKNQVH